MFNVTVGGVTTIICIHTVCSVIIIIIIIIIIILSLLSAVLWLREAGHYDPSDRGLQNEVTRTPKQLIGSDADYDYDVLLTFLTTRLSLMLNG